MRTTACHRMLPKAGDLGRIPAKTGRGRKRMAMEGYSSGGSWPGQQARQGDCAKLTNCHVTHALRLNLRRALRV
eukprot:364305-Chlamydomonas_euryale.AAC.6